MNLTVLKEGEVKTKETEKNQKEGIGFMTSTIVIEKSNLTNVEKNNMDKYSKCLRQELTTITIGIENSQIEDHIQMKEIEGIQQKGTEDHIKIGITIIEMIEDIRIRLIQDLIIAIEKISMIRHSIKGR